MANDSTVKAGSWGARTVEKILRIQEYALRHELLMLYLVDWPGPGSPTRWRCSLPPGGREDLLANQVHRVPQPAACSGPSALRGLHPRFCDGLHGRGQRLDVPGSPAWPRWSSGRRPPWRRCAGATAGCRAAATCSAPTRTRPSTARRYLSSRGTARTRRPSPLGAGLPGPVAPLIPTDESQPFDVYPLVAAVASTRASSRSSGVRRRGGLRLARIEGRAVGIVANQPLVKGGVLFVDSADKVARFVWLCDAFNLRWCSWPTCPGS